MELIFSVLPLDFIAILRNPRTGFGESSKSITVVNTELYLDDIDYFFVLSKDMLSWKVFSSLNPIDDIFTKKNGKVDKIKTYEVKEC